MQTDKQKSKASSSVRLWDESIKLVDELVIDAAFYEKRKIVSVEMYDRFIREGVARYRRRLERIKKEMIAA
jgi:hypothetical protein